ncbi:hypothetical protein TcG_09903 [Trypanosoma cruzi]|uniref:RRM domain-containing protein n=2 Tax=Trypanosoma cruzi TaxID=5693 RepID=V5BRQ1_TRYCR|nr:hypothetical protein TCDM_00644 [Trypanosoma cruzi Dm28c]KAF8281418.1 hypothetical protein TcBrA4_0089940 [Trypanosoma cruzi]PBJ74154.1 hypothetical protein BCY84_12989 [Trypanosoma cruzi cruzi]PWU88589.1 hypothetical protein C4B63_70g126 [Trypanosoma cruzi]RNF10066.1 hypothetical protein TcG_09903 [Trypanosoma cruzi]
MSQTEKNFAAELLEKYFGTAYLFDQANAFFREKVSPKNTAGLTTPPNIKCVSFLRFVNCTVDEKNISSLREAAASSTIVESLKGEDGEWYLRRRCFLDPKDDPAIRSVVVWPLHRASKPGEVKEFFSQYGTVESARVMLQPHGEKQLHATFVVCFATVAEATACAKANVSFGEAPSALAQHFLPSRLNVMPAEDYRAKTEKDIRAREGTQLKQNVVRAQKALMELEGQEIRRFLRKGVTLTVEGVAPGTTWQTMKMKLGNLSLTNPVLRRGITLLKVEGPDASAPSRPWRAFVICRDENTASEMLKAFSFADGEFGKQLREVCPSLRPLTDEEEDYARRHFPEWCEPLVVAKRAANSKRQRSP